MWLALPLAAAVALAAPFEDVRHRFRLELPAGWTFTPMPGDVHGATFRRQQEGLLAHAAVRTVEGWVGDLRAFADQVAAATADEPGYRLLEAGPTRVAGQPGLRRRYVVFINGDARLPKMAEEALWLAQGSAWVIHVETVADAFDGFWPDFKQLLASFQLGGSAPAAALPTPRRRVSLVGSWRGGGHEVRFSPGGVVLWDKEHGTYRLEDGVLVLQLGAQRHQYAMDLKDDRLALSGEGWPAGQALQRVVAPTP